MKLKTMHENCSGCNTCRLACAIHNFEEVNPCRGLLRIEGRFPAPGDYRIHICDQCGVCAENCSDDAIDLIEGVYVVNPDTCTGCLNCVAVCPQQVMFEQKDCDHPTKCNACGECARTCPRSAILFEESPEEAAA